MPGTSFQLDPATLKKKKATTDPVTNKQFYLKLVSIYPTFQTIFTDAGSESAAGHGVVTAAVI